MRHDETCDATFVRVTWHIQQKIGFTLHVVLFIFHSMQVWVTEFGIGICVSCKGNNYRSCDAMFVRVTWHIERKINFTLHVVLFIFSFHAGMSYRIWYWYLCHVKEITIGHVMQCLFVSPNTFNRKSILHCMLCYSFFILCRCELQNLVLVFVSR